MNPYLLILVAAGAAVGYLVDGRRGAAIGAVVVAAKPVWTLLEYQSKQAEASRLSAERNARGVSSRRPTPTPVGPAASYAQSGWRALSAVERASFIQRWGGDPSLPWRGPWESQASCSSSIPGRNMVAECFAYDASRWCQEAHPRECPTFRGV